MDCLKPLYIRGMPVPCGKCLACQYNKRSDWYVRLKEENKRSNNTIFFTLTYEDEVLPTFYGAPVVCYSDVVLFVKRLRYYVARYTNHLPKAKNEKFRYFICEEYGPTTFRPHYHGIFFNFPIGLDYQRIIQEVWKLGFTSSRVVTSPGAFNYVAKYTCSINKNLYPEIVRPRCYCSLGIGKNFVDSLEWKRMVETKEFCYRDGKYKRHLPRYYVQFLSEQDHEIYLNNIKERIKDRQLNRDRSADVSKVLNLIKRSKL